MPPLETTADTVAPEAAHREQTPRQNHSYDDPFLKAAYILTVYLCIGMFVWIVIAPASWLVYRSQFHREVTIPWMERIGFFWVLPIETVTKYKQQQLIEATHILPGALWVCLIPFQFHPGCRRNYPKLHRCMGYVFILTSLSIASGIFIIQYRRLTYDYFFPDLPGRLGDTLQIPSTWIVTLWFAGTGIQAVRFARAGRFRRHRAYMIRHVAAGLWVSTQRMLIFPMVHLFCRATVHPPEALSSWFRREVFGGTANLAMLLTAVAAEWIIRRLQATASKKIKARATPRPLERVGSTITKQKLV